MPLFKIQNKKLRRLPTREVNLEKNLQKIFEENLE